MENRFDIKSLVDSDIDFYQQQGKPFLEKINEIL